MFYHIFPVLRQLEMHDTGHHQMSEARQEEKLVRKRFLAKE